MTKARIISGSLVDAKNVGVHKSLRLIIDVPQERALEVIDKLGWPTQASPIPVAIARLDKEVMPIATKSIRNQSPDTTPAASPTPISPRAHRPVAAEKRFAQQAGMCCSDPVFQAFLYEHDMAIDKSEECATTAVRLICSVSSRKDIVPGTPAGDEWDKLVSKFIAWKIAA